MNTLIRVCITVVLFCVYLYVNTFGILVVATHKHAGVVECPYLIGQHALCTMDIFAHLRAWRDTNIGWFRVFFFYITIGSAFFLHSFWLRYHLLIHRYLLYLKKIRFRRILHTILLQLSQGILNPKPY